MVCPMNSELLAYTFHHLYGLNCTGLRFFTVYGPRGRPDMAPFKFIDRVFNGEAIQQYGDGSTSRDYTYIDDIVAGVVAAIDTPLGCEVVNLGNGKPYLLKDFIALVETCVGKKAVIEVLPEQPGDVDRTCADISKARNLLGYQPQVSFSEGIARTAAWYKQAHSEGLFDDASDRSRSSSGASSASVSDASSDEATDGNAVSDDDAADLSAVGLDISGADEAPQSAGAVPQPPTRSPKTPRLADVIAAAADAVEGTSSQTRHPSRHRTVRSRSADYPSHTSSHHRHSSRDRRYRFSREGSDLELSSYVEKADTQLKSRTARILHFNRSGKVQK